jgi:hypothetical protein
VTRQELQNEIFSNRSVHILFFFFLVIPFALAQTPSIVTIHANDYTKLLWYQAELRGLRAQEFPSASGGPPWGTQGWSSTQSSAYWEADVERAGAYEVSLLYLCPPGAGGSQFEVTAENSLERVTGTTRVTGNAWRNPGWELQKLNGLLKLKPGRTHITFRTTSKREDSQEFCSYVLSNWCCPRSAKTWKSAQKLKANTQWMVDAKYGLMTHWNPRVQPRRGPQKPYCEAVRDFDVESYVRMVQDTGAGYLVFTTGWGGFWFPAPIRTINQAIPGRGCDRDLIMELADSLAKRNIKLILYWGWNIGSPDYQQAWGNQLSQWPTKLSAFLEEIGQHYGTRVSAFFFDGSYESQVYPYSFPYAKVTRAAKTGNPNRVVSCNNWIFPKITSFQDYWIGESAHDLLPSPGAAAFQKGGPQEGMQAHLTTFLDDTDMLPPWHTTDQVVTYVCDAVSQKTVPSINIAIYQDATVQDATLQQMVAVRKAIRGQ